MTLHQFQSRPRGAWIVYHTGDYSDEIGRTVTGKLAMSLQQQGRVVLVQRRINDDPRMYEYIAVKVK